MADSASSEGKRWLVKQVREQQHFYAVVPGRWEIEVEAWKQLPPPVGEYLVPASERDEAQSEVERLREAASELHEAAAPFAVRPAPAVPDDEWHRLDRALRGLPAALHHEGQGT